MQLLKDIATIGQLPTILKLKKGMTPKSADVTDCFGARVEENARRHGSHNAIVCEGKEVNWTEFNALANQYADAMRDQGLVRNDRVCVMMENRIEFLALLVGLNKLGVTAGLLNTNLTGRSLEHCINVIEAKKCIFGGECAAAVAQVQADLALASPQDFLFISDAPNNDTPCPAWALDLDELQARASVEKPQRNRTQHLGSDCSVYLHLRHHGASQGCRHVQSPLPHERRHVRHRGSENQARQPHLPVSAPVSRNRPAVGRRLGVNHRG